jgi:hypothetical protein
VLAYGAPLLLAIALCGLFYTRSISKWPAIKQHLSSKHTLNVCQIYAFSYQQRHPAWTESPWTDCQPLIQATFGKPRVTLWEATQLNPRAMLAYYWWNLKLVPTGLQVLLFNVASGGVSPDYAPVSFNSPLAILGSCLFIAVLILGSACFLQAPGKLFAALVQPRLWGWIMMLCVASVVVVIMIIERPRPSYMFSLGLVLMAATGLSLQLIAHRWDRILSLSWLFPILVAALLVLTPCYFYHRVQFDTRPNLEAYRHLRPFQDVITPNVALVAPNAAAELCFYLSRVPNHYCQGIDYWAFRNSTSPAADWNEAFAQRHVKFFLADESILNDKSAGPFLQSAEANGWHTIEVENVPGNRWKLLEKP